MRDDDARDEQVRYVSRGGLKLHHALREFALDPTGLWCADLGCSTGGFTHCLLEHGAERVFAVDTGYGVLDYRLRTDDRVSVHERSNALHFAPPAEVTARCGVDLVTIDMSWTVQERCLPAATQWLRPGGRIITLVKPHYEATGGPFREEFAECVENGVLDESAGKELLRRTLDELPRLGFEALAWTASPTLGRKRKPKRRRKPSDATGSGNLEYLALLRPVYRVEPS
ncbi:MAG: TlyA family rRNA (cytidine-2'-O)-methyltransferase [bacterium]|nr:TlyA family rRNA (cytidine-2'-O)-methyltransferase [bacterium]